MKPQFLFIPMLLLCACRTTAGTKEKPDMSTSSAKPELLLQKIIDEERKNDQYFDCKVMSTDVPDAQVVRKWISHLSRKVVRGYHFMATSPSIQLYAFDGETKIVILVDGSAIEKAVESSPSEIEAVTELTKVINQYCPTPNKTK